MNLIDTYISTFPQETQKVLNELRVQLKSCAPDAQEVMSYGVPALKGKKVIIVYAAFNNHIGLYPTPPVIEKFQDKLKEHKTSKGAIQFPLSKPLPYPIIKEIMKECVERYL